MIHTKYIENTSTFKFELSNISSIVLRSKGIKTSLTGLESNIDAKMVHYDFRSVEFIEIS